MRQKLQETRRRLTEEIERAEVILGAEAILADLRSQKAAIDRLTELAGFDAQEAAIERQDGEFL